MRIVLAIIAIALLHGCQYNTTAVTVNAPGTVPAGAVTVTVTSHADKHIPVSTGNGTQLGDTAIKAAGAAVGGGAGAAVAGVPGAVVGGGLGLAGATVVQETIK
jgi:hypothetical protein